MTTTAADPKPHPAKFSDNVLAAIAEVLVREDVRLAQADPDHDTLRVLDPFAGVGRIHELGDSHGFDTVGIEIEPEWATQHPDTQIGNALDLSRFDDASFDAIVTSPHYGNRMSDHHDARERCSACRGTGQGPVDPCPKCGGTGRRDHKRHTYRHYLERPLSEGNAAGIPWGRHYRAFYDRAWREARKKLRPLTWRRVDDQWVPNLGGLAVINVKDFYATEATGEPPVLQRPAEYHLNAWSLLGATIEAVIPVDTPGQRHGANREARGVEVVIVARMGTAPDPSQML